MSLINDALKRAKETPPPPPAVPEEAMQAATPARDSKWPLFAIPVLLLTVLGLAVWFLAKGFEVAKQIYQSSSPTPVQARELPEQSTEPVAAVAPAEPAPAEPVPAEAAGPAPAVGGTVAASAVTAPPPEPTFPELTLQALFYRPRDPSAVISGKTVEIGSRVQGATVLSITQEGVQVIWEGEMRELVLP